jgi:hypothetical protein
MTIEYFKCAVKNTCGLNTTQMNLICIATIAIVCQGIGFYYINRGKMNIKLFIFVVLIGITYNTLYFKTYVTK